jgi:hypothetical protein
MAIWQSVMQGALQTASCRFTVILLPGPALVFLLRKLHSSPGKEVVAFIRNSLLQIQTSAFGGMLESEKITKHSAHNYIAHNPCTWGMIYKHHKGLKGDH